MSISSIDELKELKKLYDDGILSESEFSDAKRNVLNPNNQGQSNVNSNNRKEHFFESAGFAALMYFFVPFMFLGIVLMWAYKHFSLLTRVVATGAWLLLMYGIYSY